MLNEPYAATSYPIIMSRMSSISSSMKQIQDTHAPDGREIDVKTLLQIVEDILSNSTVDANRPLKTVEEERGVEDQAQSTNSYEMLDAVSDTIDRISGEIFDFDKVIGVEYDHSTTLAVLRFAANYSWDAKLVLTLAAFALKYGEFWLLTQMYSSNKLAKAMSVLKRIPIIMDHEGPLKPRLQGLQALVTLTVKVTRTIVEFEDLPFTNLSEGTVSSATLKVIISSVYWTIRSILACVAQISNLGRVAHDYEATRSVTSVPRDETYNDIWYQVCVQEAAKLIPFSEKLRNMHRLLEEKRDEILYLMFRDLFSGKLSEDDDMKFLKILIHASDDVLPLVDGSTKKKVNIDVLRRKNVFLLISDLNMPYELSVLEHIYIGSKHQATMIGKQFEIVWIPIVDGSVLDSVVLQNQFQSPQAKMPWYTVSPPSLIETAVIRFIKEDWHFSGKALLVALDGQGRIVSHNAIHMVRIWGSKAFPFTRTREELLWTEEKWSLEFLVNNIDAMILNWSNAQKYILLYGGEDVEWIRRFSTTAHAVAKVAGIPLEMLYICRGKNREKIRRILDIVAAEKLSHSWQDLSMVSFFWTRVESMLLSKAQLAKANEPDSITQEIKKLLGYDQGGWAVFSKGSNIVINGHGNRVLTALMEYELWKEHIPVKGFESAFREHLDELQDSSHPCCRFEYPRAVAKISGSVNCPHCHIPMEMFTSFRCCHDKRTT